MGDRTWVTGQFHPDDIGKMRELRLTYIEVPTAIPGIDAGATEIVGGYDDWRFDKDDGFVDFMGYDVNYGGGDDFSFMAREGIRFTMSHGAGANYSGGTMVSLDGESQFCLELDSVGIVVSVDNRGDPCPEERSAARRYFKILGRLNKVFDYKGKEYEGI